MSKAPAAKIRESSTTSRPRNTRTPTSRSIPDAKPTGSPERSTTTKTFVLDTNVLLHNPQSLFVFDDNDVVIPFTVLEEIDQFKGQNNDIGRAARETARLLDRLRQHGSLIEGVRLGGDDGPTLDAAGANRPTGLLRIATVEDVRPAAIGNDVPDNRILGVAHGLHHRGERVVFVSKDINARIKADALGIAAEDFENQKVNLERLFCGYINLTVPTEIIDEMYREELIPLHTLLDAVVHSEGRPANGDLQILPNEYVLLTDATDPSHTGIGRRLASTDHIIPISGPRKPVFGIVARNLQQTMAFDLLMNPEIQLVTMIGSAGTGKTLLAVAAGMAQVFGNAGHRGGEASRYEKLLVARPIMPLGRDIGYLPGDKDEKLTAWMQPIFDNLAYLLSTRASSSNEPHSYPAEQQINKFMADGRLVLEPLTYIRGRSIPHQYIIIDEAQNLSPHEVKTIVSRVGEGTKIILTGDIEQIDHPYLDSSSNGLSYAVDRLKGAPMVGHMTLVKSERSELASLAIDRL